MKTAILCALVGLGAVSTVSVIAADSAAAVYVKDSIITTKVKAKLAEKHVSTLTNINVDTDKDGVVYLSGKAPTKDASDLAEMTAKATEGVRSVHNNITVE